ncbi:hypothetical protein DFJ73DRAFT_804700 [Zopfochytrium polystomum]|nr:hypothetical protein DFJ73DRAFT_804700 [Zopfochytrium polystomum]
MGRPREMLQRGQRCASNGSSSRPRPVVVGAGKAFVEGHHRQRKVAQKATQENYKKKFEEDKDKETKRVNHFAEDPSQSCYSVCGGTRTHTLTDCSKKKKFKPDTVSSLRRAIDSLFEEEEWAESDLDEDGAVDDFVADAATDVDSLVQDAIKNNPLSSKNPLTPYQKKPLSRTNSAPSKLSAGSAKAEKVPESAAAQSPAAAAAAVGSKSPSKSWNPFKKKPTSPDEIKHVKSQPLAVLCGALQPAEASPAPLRNDEHSSIFPARRALAPQCSALSLASKLFRRIEPISTEINATSAAIAATQGAKALVEKRFKDGFEQDKGKENKIINHYEEDPSHSCYTV